jgi:hypothetical protein
MSDMGPHAEPHADVAGFLLGALEDDEAIAFVAHLERCASCRAEVDDLRAVPPVLVDLPPEARLPADLERRTLDAVARAARQDPDDGSGDQTLGAGGQGRSPVTPLGSRAAGRRWSTLQLAASSIAAAAVAACVVGAAALVGGGGGAGAGGGAAVTTIRLGAPGGGPAQATATIKATLAGDVIDMNVTDLPPSPPGTFYTCWAVGAGDTPLHQNRVSVGSFVVGPSRSVKVEWTTGADLKKFPSIGVTLEPENGDPLHQGPRVLQAG